MSDCVVIRNNNAEQNTTNSVIYRKQNIGQWTLDVVTVLFEDGFEKRAKVSLKNYRIWREHETQVINVLKPWIQIMDKPNWNES